MLFRSPSRAAEDELRLEYLRFRRLVESSGSITALIEDGQEKMKGEYIFDRQYVLALVDQAVELLSMVAFDASVLAPGGGRAFYASLDELKTFAQAHFVTAPRILRPDPPTGDSSGPLQSEPEFLLLAEALAWMAGPLPDQLVTVTGLLTCVFDETIPLLRNAAPPVLPTYSVEPEDACCTALELVDLGGGVGGHGKKRPGRISVEDLTCRPVLSILRGAAKRDPGHPQPERTRPPSLALVQKDGLSLRSTRDGRHLVLEATQSGSIDTDFVFVFVAHPLPSTCSLPAGFRRLISLKGVLGWYNHLREDEMTDKLEHLAPCFLA